MDVSIVIVNYNTCRKTSECLASIFAQTTGLDFEVIVVDNASTDDSVKCLRQDPRIVLVENPTNPGFGAANNVGADRATGKYLFFLNSDTLLLNNAVKTFFDYLESHPGRKRICGCVLQNADGSKGGTVGFPTLAGTLKWAASCHVRWLFRRAFGLSAPAYDYRKAEAADEAVPVDVVSGADLFMPADMFRSCDGFDTRFFMYFEEVDLQKRLADQGVERLLIPGPGIYHAIGASAGKVRPFLLEKISTESLLLYLRKHSRLGPYALFRILYFFIRIPVFLLKPYSRREKAALAHSLIRWR